jgi:hypothetical protein
LTAATAVPAVSIASAAKAEAASPEMVALFNAWQAAHRVGCP